MRAQQRRPVGRPRRACQRVAEEGGPEVRVGEPAAGAEGGGAGVRGEGGGRGRRVRGERPARQVFGDELRPVDGAERGQPGVVGRQLGEGGRAGGAAGELGEVGGHRVVEAHLAAGHGVREQQPVEGLGDGPQFVAAVGRHRAEARPRHLAAPDAGRADGGEPLQRADGGGHLAGERGITGGRAGRARAGHRQQHQGPDEGAGEEDEQGASATGRGCGRHGQPLSGRSARRRKASTRAM